MGADNPLAALSEQPQHLSHYFRQKFAQVSNPPIDSIRERSVMSLTSLLGRTRNVLDELQALPPVAAGPSGAHQRGSGENPPHPIGWIPVHEIECLFYVDNPETGLENAIKSICRG